MDGKVVATHKVMPARRPSQLLLWADDEGVEMVADGSDLMTAVAAVADSDGTIKRLNNSHIRFEVEGPEEIVGNARTFTNPREVEWGTAPVLLRSTLVPGTVKLKAYVTLEGKHTPLSAELVINVRPAPHAMITDALLIR